MDKLHSKSYIEDTQIQQILKIMKTNEQKYRDWILHCYSEDNPPQIRIRGTTVYLKFPGSMVINLTSRFRIVFKRAIQQYSDIALPQLADEAINQLLILMITMPESGFDITEPGVPSILKEEPLQDLEKENQVLREGMQEIYREMQEKKIQERQKEMTSKKKIKPASIVK